MIQLPTDTAELSLSEQRELLARLLRAKTAEPKKYPLSFAQQRLWFLDQLEPGGHLYNLPVAVRLQGELDVRALEATLNEIIRRHEVLRTRFGMVDGEPAQIVAVEAPRYRLQAIAVKEAEVRPLARAEAEAPFDLGTGPLLRVKLLRVATDDHVVLFTMHHIISDGWSTSILVREVTALYEAYGKGAASPLPELAIQYADYAAWQREWLQGAVLEEQLSYWRRQLGGELPVLELPLDGVRPAVQSYQGAQESFLLEAEVTEQLQQLSRREDCTLFMTLLAAYQVLLCRYSGQEDVVVGTPIAGRNRAETEPLIGFFVNMLALRTDLSGNPSFVEVMRRVKEVALGAFMHQDLPFEKLVEELQPERDSSRSPVFQAVFGLHNQGRESLGLAGLRLSGLGSRMTTSKFELTLAMMELEEGMAVTLEYNTDLFAAETIRRMGEHLRELLRAVAAEPEQSIWEAGMVGAAERELLAQWNETSTEYEREAGIAELFERQVEQRPAAIAVVYETEQVSYAELNERANQLAHHLRKLGVGPEVLVGVMLERSVEMIVALLAVVKAGGGYLPLDPAYPLERLSFMLEDGQPAVLLTEAKQLDQLPTFWGTVLCLEDSGEWAAESKENPATVAGAAEHLAYVSYTSGSTGQPKGVMVTQRGVVRLVRGTDYAEFGSEQVYLQYAPITFDASTFEIWGSLLHGARLVVMKAGTATLGELAATVRREQVSVLWLTAGLFQQMVESEGEALANVRQLLAGGDVLPVRQVREHLQQRRSGKLINGYGPTESTTFACTHELEQWEAQTTVPIGRPIANTQAYVVERRGWMGKAGVGVSGELYLGGDGLARGYLQRPELTAEKFVPDPFSGTAGARLYRTGDLVRYDAEGRLEFLGRMDQQVKLRGYRIELGEIEAALMEQGAVREAVVMARVEPGGEKRLVGYVVGEVKVEELRQGLRAKLPEYMVPSAFVVLESLPLTANGKLDRRSLPAPEGSNSAEEYLAPRTPIEELIAAIFQEVLGVERVGVADNFFELGGHSLLAVRLMACIEQQTGQVLPLATLFRSPTVASLSSALSAEMENSRWSPLVQLQAGGEARPFFCVHPGGGNVLCYGELFSHLGTARPFYGLQAYGLDGEQTPLQRVEEMAARYIEAIQSVQANGPYFIGGWSLGGLIAFEMAQQLVSRGEEIALLTLFDTSLPSAAAAPAQDDDTSMLLSFAHDCGLTANDLNISWSQFNQLGREEKLAHVLDHGKVAGFIPTEIGLAQIQNLFKVFESNVRAGESYIPRQYGGPLILFKASDTRAIGGKDVSSGWKELAPELELFAVPGSHYNMLKAPHVQVLAGQMKRCFESVEGNNSK